MSFMEDLAKRELLCGEIWVGSYFPSSRQLTSPRTSGLKIGKEASSVNKKIFSGGSWTSKTMAFFSLSMLPVAFEAGTGRHRTQSL